MGIEISPLNVLAVLATSLLVAITLGVVYLTALEWRDRRWQEREKRENRKSRSSKGSSSKGSSSKRS